MINLRNLIATATDAAVTYGERDTEQLLLVAELQIVDKIVEMDDTPPCDYQQE